MTKKWYESKAEHASCMRIIAMMSTATGCAAVISGIVAMFMRIPESVMIATVGAGMAGLGEVMKGYQARGEK